MSLANQIEWINSLQIADFYTYLTFIGVVSVWSIFGFIMILMVSHEISSLTHNVD